MTKRLSPRQIPSIVVVLAIAFIIGLLLFSYFPINAEVEPTIVDNELRVEVVTQGVKFPSNIAFLGQDDILVLEKDTGKVRRIVNGVMLEKTIVVRRTIVFTVRFL